MTAFLRLWPWEVDSTPCNLQSGRGLRVLSRADVMRIKNGRHCVVGPALGTTGVQQCVRDYELLVPYNSERMEIRPRERSRENTSFTAV
jgi:hypothetical protein